MKHALVIGLWLIPLFGWTQNFHAQLFFGGIRSGYKAAVFTPNPTGLSLGGRLAVGFDHVQLGVESEALSLDLTRSGTDLDTIYGIASSYRGLLVRANFSSVPAYRLGVVTKIGFGQFADTFEQQINGESISIDYPERIWGGNVGLGLSGRILKTFHWEFMYQLGYHKRPALAVEQWRIEAHQAWEHTFQFGLSINLVVGRAKRKADAIWDTRPD